MIGATLGSYRIVSEIGSGGMGVVYLAEHLHIGRKFALKLLTKAVAQNPTAIERLKQEAIAASRIEHDNIVEIVSFDATPEGEVFIVMELLRGTDLAGRPRLRESALAKDRGQEAPSDVGPLPEREARAHPRPAGKLGHEQRVGDRDVLSHLSGAPAVAAGAHGPAPLLNVSRALGEPRDRRCARRRPVLEADPCIGDDAEDALRADQQAIG